MDRETIYNEFYRIALVQFEAIKNEISSQQSKGYLKCDSTIKNEGGRINFFVGVRKFVIKFSIKSLRGDNNNAPQFSLNTFEIVDNIHDFGKEIMRIIDDLAVLGSFDEVHLVKTNIPRLIDLNENIGRDYILAVKNYCDREN